MRFLGGLLATMYFVCLMVPILLLLFFMPLIFLTEINSIRSSGFAGPNTVSAAFIFMIGWFVGLSLLIPPFRRMYRFFPWLYPLIQILFVNFIILTIGLLILNYGYEENSAARHTVFFILMIVQLIVCRLAMCTYYKFKPVYFGEKRDARG